MEPQFLTLDCPPGGIRPGDLLPGVLKDTGLSPEDFTVVSKLFGSWQFNLTNQDKSPCFEQVRYTLIKDRITKLYNDGLIRYGDW